MFVSGESAADDLLRAATLTLYVEEHDPRLPIVNNRRSDGPANIVVRRKFWHAPDNSDAPLAGVRPAPGRWFHADLASSDDPRARNVAKSGGTALLDLSNTPHGFLDPVARVVDAALRVTDGLSPDKVMVVGAWCRDILHSALVTPSQRPRLATSTSRSPCRPGMRIAPWQRRSHVSATPASASASPTSTSTCCRAVTSKTPHGVVDPPTRGEALSVWAFEKIFAASLHLALSLARTIRIPTVAGYVAAKLGAWLDRFEWLEAKDAADLALILHWYAESADPHERLYETPAATTSSSPKAPIYRSRPPTYSASTLPRPSDRRFWPSCSNAGQAKPICSSASSNFVAVRPGRAIHAPPRPARRTCARGRRVRRRDTRTDTGGSHGACLVARSPDSR
ncbi:MAG: type IV toxin-antitoxin system AbiEi family antitoxin [Jiangellaceae bacterium]